MKRAWLVWIIFACCAAAVLAIVAWTSGHLLHAEQNITQARREAELEESVRLSLWRMDTALASLIIQENARPSADYLRAQASPYVKDCAELADDGQVSPAPAATGPWHSAALIPLRAAIPKTWLRIEQSTQPAGRAPSTIAAAQTATPSGRAPSTIVAAHTATPSGRAPSPIVTAQPAPVAEPLQQLAQLSQQNQAQQVQNSAVSPAQSQMQRNVTDFQARGLLNLSNAAPAPAPPVNNPARGPLATVEVRTGALAPIWVGDHLLLARHIQAGANGSLQACRVDWPKLRATLLESVADLLPGSNLIPERGKFDPAEGRTLTSLPLRLVPAPPLTADAASASPILFSLRIAWVCTLLAILAVALLLQGAISLSQRRAAFVSSVTHELRSPLTTFRMYTEMLVEGVAADPAKQQQYLQTLYRESNRLVHLVENVLSYARLEKGRYGERELVSLGDLLERTRDRLAGHANLAGMQLLVALEPDLAQRQVRADVAAIERILFNLVDNACKYARSSDPRIHLEVSVDDRRAFISVRDHGPGMNPSNARRLFRPFRKTAAEAAKTAPGVGIGLSLSRRLAKAAGGRLRIVPCEDGARVTLELPLSQAPPPAK